MGNKDRTTFKEEYSRSGKAGVAHQIIYDSHAKATRYEDGGGAHESGQDLRGRAGLDVE